MSECRMSGWRDARLMAHESHVGTRAAPLCLTPAIQRSSLSCRRIMDALWNQQLQDKAADRCDRLITQPVAWASPPDTAQQMWSHWFPDHYAMFYTKNSKGGQLTEQTTACASRRSCVHAPHSCSRGHSCCVCIPDIGFH